MASTLRSTPSNEFKFRNNFYETPSVMSTVTSYNTGPIWPGYDEVCSPYNTAGEVDAPLLYPEISNVIMPSNFVVSDPFRFLETDLSNLSGSILYPNPDYEELGQNFGMVALSGNNEEGHRMTTNCFPPTHSPGIGDSWGVQGQALANSSGEVQVKVGRYTVEERRDRILRYLKKRNQRNFHKTIKYACRKTLADRRVRIRGRFAKNHEEHVHSNNNDNNSNNNQSAALTEDNVTRLYNLDHQRKEDEDDWLQEAMASLMCVPSIGSLHRGGVLD